MRTVWPILWSVTLLMALVVGCGEGKKKHAPGPTNTEKDDSDKSDKSDKNEGDFTEDPDEDNTKKKKKREKTSDSDDEDTIDSSYSCLKGGSNYEQYGSVEPANFKPMGSYDLWVPKNFGKAGCKHPLITWGNGTGVSGGLTFWSYGHYGRHLASYGFVVVMNHADGGGGNSGGGPLKSGVEDLLSKDEYAKHISDDIGTFGHSQGGLAAISYGNRESRVKAIVSLQGYGFPPSKPIMYLTGEADPSLAAQGAAAYRSTGGDAFLGELKGADHIMAPTFGGVRTYGLKYGGATVAFFLCKIAEDSKACDWLESDGKSGGKKFCDNSEWTKCEAK